MRIVLIFILLFTSVCFGNISERAGTAGNSFLEIGAGAYGAAMGNTHVSYTGDENRVFWNPSLNSWIDKIGISFTYGIYFKSMNYICTVINVPIKKVLNLSVGFIRLGYGNLSIATIGSGGQINESRSIKPSDYAATLSLSRNISKKIGLGLSGKFIGNIIGEDKAYTYSFDAGLIYRNVFENFNIGISFNDIGQGSKFYSHRNYLPTTFKCGISYNFKFFKNETVYIRWAIDLLIPFKNKIKINTGLDFNFLKYFALRIGYKILADTLGLTAGAGINIPVKDKVNIIIDFAYLPYSKLGNNFYFTLSTRF